MKYRKCQVSYTVHRSTLVLGDLCDENKRPRKRSQRLLMMKYVIRLRYAWQERRSQVVFQHLHENVQGFLGTSILPRHLGLEPPSRPPSSPRLRSQLPPRGSTLAGLGVGSASTMSPIHPGTNVWKQKRPVQMAKCKRQAVPEVRPCANTRGHF